MAAKKTGGQGVAYLPTDRERASVSAMVACGMSLENISSAISLDRKTVSKHFKAEIENGKLNVLGQLTSNAVAQALAGDRTLTMFILKTQYGWKEKSGLELSGVDGAPIAIDTVRRILIDPKDQDN